MVSQTHECPNCGCKFSVAILSAERKRFQPGDRVEVLIGEFRGLGTIVEDIAAIWVKHDSDGVYRSYRAGEVTYASIKENMFPSVSQRETKS